MKFLPSIGLKKYISICLISSGFGNSECNELKCLNEINSLNNDSGDLDEFSLGRREEDEESNVLDNEEYEATEEENGGKVRRDVFLDLDPRGLTDRTRPSREPKDRVLNDEGSTSTDPSVRFEKDTRGGGSRSSRLRSNTLKLQTKIGVVTGTVERSKPVSTSGVRGRPYYSFKGIPYAEPPVGELRFELPVLMNSNWQGGFIDGTRFKSFCPQYDHDNKKMVGNEDCLYLNIYTPFLRHERVVPLPVLVFIHGGSYTRGGASSHGPEKLMNENIIVVTINYRLGVLGFLSTGTEELAGNLGLFDQLTALRWISMFIEHFNGDPNQVTLGGFSAGASMVHLHVLSTLSQGLFHRAIIMSGSGNCQWSVQSDPLKVAAELAGDLDCPIPPSQEFKDCLKQKTPEELIEAQTERHRYVYWPFLYRPVVDGGLREEPFLSKPVEELMKSPPTLPMPVLGGATQFEGLLFALTTLLFSPNPSKPSEVYDEATLYLLGSLWPNETSRADVAATLHSFYYTTSAKENLDILLEQMTESLTDQIVTSCLWDALDHLASTKIFPVYTYLMTHHDSSSPAFAHPLYRLARDQGVRSPLLQSAASHGDDVILLFDFPHSQIEPGPRDVQMSSILTNMWANFVKSGSPVAGRISTGVPPWKPVSPGSPLTYYRLSLTPGTVTRPFRSKERNLWQQTLKVAEHISEEKTEFEESLWDYQLATWILLVLCIFLILVLVALLVAICISRRRRKYSTRGATLRSNQPRSSTYEPSNRMSNGVAEN